MNVLTEGDGSTAILAFTAYGCEAGGHQWRRALRGVNARKIFAMDPSRRWYLGGIEGFAGDVAHTAERFSQLVAGRPLITLGASMGGFAALLYGSLLGARCAIGLGANISVQRDFLEAIGDRRCWEARIALNEAGLSPLDLRQVVAAAPSMAVTLFHDPQCVHDVAHADRLAGLSNVTVKRAYGGHECGLAMRRSGHLARVITAALNEQAPQATR